MKSITAQDRAGHPIAWREAGDGAPVIFLHAMVTSRLGWEPQMARLARDYRCIAWDMPGYGGSAPAPADAGMQAVLDLLTEFVTATLGLRSAHFVGLSVGGMMLQHLAARRPDLVRSITLIDCSPKFGFGGGSSPEEFESWVRNSLDTQPLTEFCRNMIAAITAPGAGREALEASERAMGQASREGLDLAARLIARHDALDALGQITCPTLVMAGAEDKETPPSYAQAIAARIPGANLSIIPGAGHIAPLEAPAAVSDRLHTFLAHGL